MTSINQTFRSDSVIVLFLYHRPHLTRQAITSILKWGKFKYLLLSVDGIRYSANEFEQSSREHVMQICYEFAKKDSRIRCHFWQENRGLTNHAYRIFSLAIQLGDWIISLEEDNQITSEGLEFLTSSDNQNRRGQAKSAYTSISHQVEGVDDCSLLTFFPEQWGTAFSKNIIITFLDTVSSGQIRRRYIRNSMRHHSNLFLKFIHTEFWYEHLKQCINHPSYGDAIMQYSAWRNEVPYQVPLVSYVRDVSQLEIGGINSRPEKTQEEEHLLVNSGLETIFCGTCEEKRSLRDDVRFATLLGSKKYRLFQRLSLIRFGKT